MRIARLVGAAVLAFTSACFDAPGDASAEMSGVTVHDSAGVEIVEVQRSAEADTPEWTVDPTPTVEIAGANEEEGHVFTRIGPFLTLPDGGLLVVEPRADEIRRFDASGRFVQTFGRSGEGPGEFGTIASLTLMPGDSILVWDDRLRRFTVLSPELTMVRTAPSDLESWASSASIMAVLADGTLVTGVGMGPVPVPGAERVPSHRAFLRVGPDGELIDTMATALDAMHTASSSGSGELAITIFGPYGTAFWGNDGFWQGTQEHPQFLRFDSSGRLERILRIEVDDRTVTDAEIEAFINGAPEPYPPEVQASNRRYVELQPISPTFPAWEWLSVGPEGDIWVKRFTRPSEGAQPWRFSIFGQDGRPMARIELPEGWWLRGLDADHILVVKRDEYDRETLARHRILKTDSGR